jgi:hypothetical protein
MVDKGLVKEKKMQYPLSEKIGNPELGSPYKPLQLLKLNDL